MPYDLYPAVDENYDFPPEVRAALAKTTELRNTVVPMTQTARNNLTGPELWNGRLIYNTTTERINRYDAVDGAWFSIDAEMLTSLQTHDHRLDGTKGAPFKLSPPDDWHVVPDRSTSAADRFQGNWGHAIYSAFPNTKYIRDAAGNVEIRGSFWEQYGVANGTTVFYLPSGYLPTSRVTVFGTHTGSQPALCLFDIYTDGRVVCSRTSGSDPGGTGYTVHIKFQTW